MMYNISNIVFTWGTPILGGYLSQNNEGFRNQIMITNIIQAFSIVLLIFATPETTFSRSSTVQPSGMTTTVSAPSAGKWKSYLSTLRFTTPDGTSKQEMLRPLHALAAPSTILTFLLTAPTTATAYGIASTLSLLFGAMPTFLFPARIGYLFIAPLGFSLLFYSLASLATSFMGARSPTASKHLAAAVPGLMLGFAGTVAFGMYMYDKLMSTTLDKRSGFSLYIQGQDLSLITVSLLFGLLVSGSILTNHSGISHLSTSTSREEESSALEGAHRVLQDVLTGIFVIGMPLWIKGGADMLAGLKDAGIALAVLQVVVGSSVGAVLWVKGGVVGGFDGRVLGRRVEVVGLKREDGFFEA
jgi:hypothetical protein